MEVEDIIVLLNKLQIRVTEPKSTLVAMSKDMAMKTLGLTGLQGQQKGKVKTVNDYSEEEINKAFQAECKNLSKFQWESFGLLQPQIETVAKNRTPPNSLSDEKMFLLELKFR